MEILLLLRANATTAPLRFFARSQVSHATLQAAIRQPLTAQTPGSFLSLASVGFVVYIVVPISVFPRVLGLSPVDIFPVMLRAH